MTDFSARLVLFWGFDKPNLRKRCIELRRVIVDIGCRREYGEEVIKVMGDVPAMSVPEDPMDCF